MPFDGSGNFQRVMNWQADSAAKIKIRSDRHDQEMDDYASGLTNCITRDGQSLPSNDLPMNGHRLTGMGAPVDGSDAATKSYVDNLKTYPQGIILPGSSENGQISFTGTTGPIGLTFDNIGPWFAGVRSGTGEFVWNNNLAGDWASPDILRLAQNGSLILANRATATGAGPLIYLDRDALVPNGSPIGEIVFRAHDSGGTIKAFGDIYTNVDVRTAGNEQSSLRFRVMTGGSLTARLVLDAAGITLNGALNAGPINCGVLEAGNVTGNIFIATAGQFRSESANTTLSNETSGGGNILIRPRGAGNGNFQSIFNPDGDLTVAGRVNSGPGQFNSQTTHVTLSGTGGSVLLRPYGPTNTSQQAQVQSNGNFIISGNGFKPGGGDWQASSDARIKDVEGDYSPGLAEVRQLKPKRYRYLGNDTDTDGYSPNAGVVGTSFVGLIAQDVEPIFPTMVATYAGFIDGEPVDDLRTIDTSELIYALVNAVSELAARTETLEKAA